MEEQRMGEARGWLVEMEKREDVGTYGGKRDGRHERVRAGQGYGR